VQTFVIRLQHAAASSAVRLRGVIDDVTTGLRATFFRIGQELVTALMALGAAHPGPHRSRADDTYEPGNPILEEL
jgi:hypothetical protein